MRPMATPHATAAAGVEVAGRSIKGIAGHNVELTEPPTELQGLHVEIAKAEPVDPDLEAVGLKRHARDWYTDRRVHVAREPRHLDRPADADTIADGIEVDVHGNPTSMPIDDLVRPVGNKAIGGVESGVRLGTSAEAQRADQFVPEVLRARRRRPKQRHRAEREANSMRDASMLHRPPFLPPQRMRFFGPV